MKISGGLTETPHELLRHHLEDLGAEARAAIALARAAKITRDRPIRRVTYEFVDAEDAVGSGIGDGFEALEDTFTQRGDHRTAIRCNQAALAIGQALARQGVNVRRV